MPIEPARLHVSVKRDRLEHAATLYAFTLDALRTKPRKPDLFLHEPFAHTFRLLAEYE